MEMIIGVVIPCYREKKGILKVLGKIGEQVSKIYVVDDCCPEQTGRHVADNCVDQRVTVLYHHNNTGVGGAVVTGYKQALAESVDIVVKIDGDGQMNPELITYFIEPLIQCRADYVKGNRFFSLSTVKAMPTLRKFGNVSLSFINKLGSGYWNIMDPTNGFTAIHSSALGMLELDKMAKDYFFESDMLFRLGTIRAVVCDLPMESVYNDEESYLSIRRVLLTFPQRYLLSFFKRIVYNYYIRDFTIASIELPVAFFLLFFGLAFGGYHWAMSIITNQVATTGTVMVAVLPIILGFQLLLSVIQFDTRNIPKIPISSLVGQLQPLIRSRSCWSNEEERDD